MVAVHYEDDVIVSKHNILYDKNKWTLVLLAKTYCRFPRVPFYSHSALLGTPDISKTEMEISQKAISDT